MRQIVELCDDSLKKVLLFPTKRLEFVILIRVAPSTVAGDESRLAQSQLVNNLTEFFLIIKPGSNHLITSFPSLLKCRPHLPATKMSSPCTVPATETGLVAKATTRHSTNSETTTDESLHQLISQRCCSWASSVQRLAQPSKRVLHGIRRAHGLVVRQSCLFSLQRRSTLAEHQTQPQPRLHAQPNELHVRSQL